MDQSCLLNESLSWNNADIEMRLQNHAQSQDNTSGVAVSYSVIWSTKPPRPAVIQEVWKKAKLALISKAAEQVQAWQQALCSYWTLENTGIRNRQGEKKNLKTPNKQKKNKHENRTCLDCLYPTILQLSTSQHTSPMRWRWLAGPRKEGSWGQ